jgi:hypothetical protein
MDRLFCLIILGLIFHNCSNDNERYIKKLPDNNLINNVISAAIDLDSLNYNYSVLKTIKNIRLYYPTKWTNDSVPPPPPPPPPFLTFYRVFTYLDNSVDSLRRFEDSIFIAFQTDTSRRFEIDNKIVSRFKDKSDVIYRFYKPIFTFDERYVFIQYWRDCGALCGECISLVLENKNNKWIKLDRWSCGEK